jgi:hypothetical protein
MGQGTDFFQNHVNILVQGHGQGHLAHDEHVKSVHCFTSLEQAGTAAENGQLGLLPDKGQQVFMKRALVWATR